MKFLSSLLISCALSSGVAQASSNQAWADYRKTVIDACLKASQLKGAYVLSTFADFDDQVGISALLIEGMYPQKHMNGKRGTELCLYDREKNVAAVSEWDLKVDVSKS
ncbi:hypothetical protein [Pseudomonas putida]|uniref:hypothetical protein n=1 Tax=Pseudomonas putida TaxID=303 RepID=UPI0037C8B129